MATSFKTFLPNDVQDTRTKLHEAIPITGSILSGTYQEVPGTELNIKNYSHGMFQSVYDYPYLSSSANHIMDLTVGLSSTKNSSEMLNPNAKNAKNDIYNEIAQVVAGYNVSGAIQQLQVSGNFGDAADNNTMRDVFVINLARLLTKDQIQLESGGGFRLTIGTTAAFNNAFTTTATIYDKNATNRRVNSPAGEFNQLFFSGAAVSAPHDLACGLLFYQAGVAVITSSVFTTALGGTACQMDLAGTTVDDLLVSQSIDNCANALRGRIQNIEFNNTTELNSTIYMCRTAMNEFNYSSNPTYLSGNTSQVVVKENATDQPVSYITTVGLYGPRNELLAVGKLSEPLKKTPADEFTIRMRLDY